MGRMDSQSGIAGSKAKGCIFVIEAFKLLANFSTNQYLTVYKASALASSPPVLQLSVRELEMPPALFLLLWVRK